MGRWFAVSGGWKLVERIVGILLIVIGLADGPEAYDKYSKLLYQIWTWPGIDWVALLKGDSARLSIVLLGVAVSLFAWDVPQRLWAKYQGRPFSGAVTPSGRLSARHIRGDSDEGLAIQIERLTTALGEKDKEIASLHAAPHLGRLRAANQIEGELLQIQISHYSGRIATIGIKSLSGTGKVRVETRIVSMSNGHVPRQGAPIEIASFELKDGETRIVSLAQYYSEGRDYLQILGKPGVIDGCAIPREGITMLLEVGAWHITEVVRLLDSITYQVKTDSKTQALVISNPAPALSAKGKLLGGD